MATRMFCELRTVRKLTEPPVESGTATTKKSTMSTRNAQAHTRLKNTAARSAGVSRLCAEASARGAAFAALSVTGRSISPSPRRRRRRGEGRGEGRRS